MNNETIKEGDYVIYVGRPSEKFLVYLHYGELFKIYLNKGQTNELSILFYTDGTFIKGDTNPIVKKTTPPKKKVLKEFDVYVDNLPTLNNHRGTFSMFGTPDREIKAKLICEVEE